MGTTKEGGANLKLRPYQEHALSASKTKLWAGVNRQLLKLPTGMGKAVVLAAKPSYMGFKNRSMVVVHREELVNQLVDTIREWNPRRSVGIEMADITSNHEDIIVASVQSIGRSGGNRISKFDPNDFDSIDVDEAHHCTGSTYQNILEHFSVVEDTHRLTLGVTATPNRADGKGLGDIFQEIVFDYSLLDGIKEGWLSDLKGIRVSTKVSLDQVHTQAGDFNTGELGDAINTDSRNDLVARAWLENGQDRHTVVFSVDIAHAQDLCLAFKRYGVACEAIWGTDPERREKLAAHKAGHLKVLVNCQILTEGYDDWKIGCIVLARPTKSETLYTQIVGRGTRIPPGIGNLVEARANGLRIDKEDCILIDVVDVTSKHSLVSLPSLFGMNKDLDMRGKKITQVMTEIEDAKKKFVDTSKVIDIAKLKSYAEAVDLFRITFTPEVVQFSEFCWFKTGEEQYLLSLQNGDSLRITHDLLDHWRVTGLVLSLPIDGTYTSFSEAIKAADDLVRKAGIGSLVKREAKWHADPPTPVQINTCRRFHIAIPEGASKGDISKRLSKMFMDMKLARESKMAVRVAQATGRIA